MDAFDTVFGEAKIDAIPNQRTPRRRKIAAGKSPMPNDIAPQSSAHSARHRISDTHQMFARGEGEAKFGATPAMPPPSPPKFARQASPETQTRSARKSSRSSQEKRDSQCSPAAPAATHSNIARQNVIDPHSGHARDGGGGQFRGDTHHAPASAAPIARHGTPDAHHSNARAGIEGTHSCPDTQKSRDPLDAIVLQIQQQWRTRQRWHRAEKMLILQAKAACRFHCGGDKAEANKLFEDPSSAAQPLELSLILQPFFTAIGAFEGERKLHEKSLEKLAKTLPVWPFAQSVKGLGALGLASIIGEAGHIDRYQDKDGNWQKRTVSKLWKYLGIGTVNGERQRKCSDLALAVLHSYSPHRRSVVWNVGNGLIGCMGHGPRPFIGEDISKVRDDWSEYQKLFIGKCRFYADKPDEDGQLGWRKSAENGEETKESYSRHVAARAKRYVEKRFLADLFAEWKNSKIGAATQRAMPTNAPPRRGRGSPTEQPMPIADADSPVSPIGAAISTAIPAIGTPRRGRQSPTSPSMPKSSADSAALPIRRKQNGK